MAAGPEHAATPSIGVMLHDFALGGSERVAIRLANAWAVAGCNVVLLAGSGEGPQRKLVRDQVPVEIAAPRVPRAGRDPAQLGAWFGRRCAALGLEAAFVPGNSYFRAVAPALASAPRLQMLAKVSNPLWRADRSMWRNLVFAMKTRRRLRGVLAVVAMSPAMARGARRALGPAFRIEVIPNPVLDAVPAAATARRRWHLCAAGRLVPQKNFSLLLQALSMLKDLPVTLDLLGEGPLEAQLRQQAARLGIQDRVNFAGRVDDVHPHLAAAEIAMITSDFEGYPAVAIEAMAAGTFLISVHCSASIPEIISSPLMGTCVSSRDPAELAAAVRRYFDNRACDRDRMRELAVQHLTSVSARRYLDILADRNPQESIRP
ncbi:MAG TPA: glycosyltransferase [Steroidobacteraceae bacterium]|nr:glycosyltransferase [Steroidobacteraceae bacterium]